MEYFIYVLNHTYTDEIHTNTKLLGFFDTIESLEEIKRIALNLPGFMKYPESFVIDRYIVNKIHWQEGFTEKTGEIGRDYLETGDIIFNENCLSVKELGLKTIFSVSHSYTTNTYLDDERYIGVFSTLADSEFAINELLLKPGFKDYPNDFDNSEIELNTLLWKSGF